MSTLLILLPTRSRLRTQAHPPGPGEGQPRGEQGPEYDYLYSDDDLSLASEGRRPASQLPKADNVVALVGDAELSWHQLQLPRAKGKRLRAALAGQMEELLLDDPEGLHFAIEPEAQGGDHAWVAVLARAWLSEHLAALDQAHVAVDRVLPLSWPDGSAQGHFFAMPDAPDSDALALRWSAADGVSTLRLEGSFARNLFAPGVVQAARWSAEPELAAAAERWLGTTVGPQSAAQRALAALHCPWNLRQFELAPRTRGLRAVRQLVRAFLHRQWRPVRWALAGLLLVHLLGLNLWAWQQRTLLEERRAELSRILTRSHPQVRAVLDAPIQMQRETDLLRASAGRPGDQDLETLLAAAATAWPGDRGPLEALSFETGRLLISAHGWSEAQIQTFKKQLQSEGWQLELNDGRMSLSRSSQGGRPS